MEVDLNNLGPKGFEIPNVMIRRQDDRNNPIAVLVRTGNGTHKPLEDILPKNINFWFDVYARTKSGIFSLRSGCVYKGEGGQLYFGIPDLIHAGMTYSPCYSSPDPLSSYLLDNKEDPKVPEGQEFTLVFSDPQLFEDSGSRLE